MVTVRDGTPYDAGPSLRVADFQPRHIVLHVLNAAQEMPERPERLKKIKAAGWYGARWSTIRGEVINADG